MCDGCSIENSKEIGNVLRGLFTVYWKLSDSHQDSYFTGCGHDLLEAYLHGIQRAYGELAPKGVSAVMYQLPMFGKLNPLWEVVIVDAIKALAKRKNLC